MWQLVNWCYGEEQRVFEDNGKHFVFVDDEEIEVPKEDCYWRWWSVDFGYVANAQPYRFGEPSPDFDPTT